MAGHQVSIQDVADRVGVSIMTVSRAMRGVEGVSGAKRTLILDVARELGYRPNRYAMSLAASHSTLIGVSLPTMFNEVFADILEGMRGVFDSAGFDLIIDNSDYDARRERNWVERMIDWKPAGVILSGIDHAPDVRRDLRQSGIPTLEIWDVTDDPIDVCVGIDHEAAGRQIGAYLVAQGYRNPAFVGVEQGHDPRAEKRFMGLKTIFADAGIHHFSINQSFKNASFEAGLAGTQSLLKDASPDCICYLNDHMAFGGLAACERLGLSVPDDIGIVGFNGLGINAVLRQPLTTVVTPRLEMGAIGARLLLARIRGARVERRTIMMSAELSTGGTTASRLQAQTT